jgi:nucleoside-diphosphate-sugar epimerase
MKIVITGNHTGIGKSLTDNLLKRGHEVLGFDLVNGDDLCDINTMNRVIGECFTADVFINNALPNQDLLLQYVYDSWSNLPPKNRTIVNMGSASTYFDESIVPQEYWEYRELKKRTDDVVRKLNSPYSHIHVMNVKPLWVDTNLVKDVEHSKMSPDDLSELICYHLDNMDKYKIMEIVVRVNE